MNVSFLEQGGLSGSPDPYRTPVRPLEKILEQREKKVLVKIVCFWHKLRKHLCSGFLQAKPRGGRRSHMVYVLLTFSVHSRCFQTNMYSKEEQFVILGMCFVCTSDISTLSQLRIQTHQHVLL